MATGTLVKQWRGKKADLPFSAPGGVLLATTDTHELYIGTDTSIEPIHVRAENVIGNVPDGGGTEPGSGLPDGATPVVTSDGNPVVTADGAPVVI